MPTENADRIKKFLKEHVYHLETEGSGGPFVDLPDYEIHPREFLEYAEAELDDLDTNQSIINCLSNLKRAIDCQIDIFLHALNILEIYQERRLGIDKKLGFIEKCGIFSKGSLSRINTIRNKMEHHYQIPKIGDITVYFDLVTAFVYVLEIQMNIGGGESEIEFNIVEYPEDEDAESIPIGKLTSTYYPRESSHIISWKIDGKEEIHKATSENLDELASFIHYHALLLNINRTYHGQYANSQLEKL